MQVSGLARFSASLGVLSFFNQRGFSLFGLLQLRIQILHLPLKSARIFGVSFDISSRASGRGRSVGILAESG